MPSTRTCWKGGAGDIGAGGERIESLAQASVLASAAGQGQEKLRGKAQGKVGDVLKGLRGR